MRPKTFPATTYSGNSRQRLQEIREGLKQPSKPTAPGPPGGPGSDAALDAKVLGGKDAARQQQQQMRSAPKFGPYQKALREIRYSLLPFANESGPSAAAEVNRQMLQELVDAGCDQAPVPLTPMACGLSLRIEMAGRALKQTGSRSIEAALEFISKMGYLEPGKEQIVRVVKQTSPGKGLAPTSVPRRPSFEGAGDPFPPYPQMSGAAYEGPAALEEAPRQYSDFLFAGAGPHCGPGRQHQPKGYEAPPLQGPHYRPHLLKPVAFLPEGPVPSRTNSFNSHQQPVAVPLRAGAPGKAEPSVSSPNTVTAVTAAHILHPVKSVRVMRPEPQTAVGPSHPAWVPAPTPARESLASKDEHPLTLGGASAHPLDVEYGGTEARGRPPPYPKHLLLQSRPEQSDVDRLCAGVEQGLLGGQATEPPDRADKGQKGAKGEKTGKDKKQIQTSPVPVRRGSRAEEKRESRVKSYSPCAFKFFMEQHVENVLKTHQQKAGLCEAEQEQMRKILYQKESNYNRLKRAKMDKSMFVKIKTLGVGAFGEVCLACKVDTHALYAMKTLRKRDVLSRNQVAHVKAERDILAEADNEWVVKLYYSFQDKDSLYFVMDYIPGGDMMSLLIRMEVFPEHLARFYIAELTLAIESVHRMGFIHRDIKPDNILIDLDGHIKLTDFGLCTGFRWTHNSKYYQKALAGCEGEEEGTRGVLSPQVVNWESTLHIPAQAELSPEARDLIAKLCCSAEHRLGRNGAADLKAHPFLGAVDFSSDIRRQPAPYVPKISHPMDTSNFDPVDEEGPWQAGSEDSTKAWDALASPGGRHPEHAFYEFTFRRFFDDNGHPFRCPKPAGPGAQAEGCQPVYV
ncbi:serine/threonine-protein kinase LATS2 [Camelus ferus]|nr:serine/threonine-protein kinase LATS2 [Camelus ferus]